MKKTSLILYGTNAHTNSKFLNKSWKFVEHLRKNSPGTIIDAWYVPTNKYRLDITGELNHYITHLLMMGGTEEFSVTIYEDE